MTSSKVARQILRASLLLFAVNVLLVTLLGGYGWAFKSFHLESHEIFKSLRWFNYTFFLLSLVIALKSNSDDAVGRAGDSPNKPWFLIALGVLILGAYYQSPMVNLHVFEWDHREMSARLHSLRDFVVLFTSPQPNRFYRPLPYISLWLDFQLFRNHLWAYHLQNLLIHFLNSILVWKVGLQLGLDDRVSRWAALLFSVAAINFEVVMWPAARFDLFATLFTLLAMLYLVKHLKSEARSHLLLAAGFFVLGVLSKESAYCFPFLAALVISLSKPNQRVSLRGRAYSFFPMALLTIALVSIRVFVQGGGGYQGVSWGTAHFQFNLQTLFLFLMNTLGLTQFAINATVPLAVYVKVAVVGFVVALAALALTAKRPDKNIYLLAGMLLLSALPVFALIGWIRPSLQNSRFLYLPAVWMSFLVASQLRSGSRLAGPVLALVLLSNACATRHNVAVYEEMLSRTDQLARLVYEDYLNTPVETIHIIGLSDAPNGVFYFPSELAFKLTEKMPGTKVALVASEESSAISSTGELVYRWDAKERTLVRQP
ncbi:MAG: glycosyltransferase family 39 protein [bacterium]